MKRDRYKRWLASGVVEFILDDMRSPGLMGMMDSRGIFRLWPLLRTAGEFEDMHVAHMNQLIDITQVRLHPNDFDLLYDELFAVYDRFFPHRRTPSEP